MDAVPRDISSLEAGVATDMRGEEEGASGDHDEGADDGDESGKLLYNVTKGRYNRNDSIILVARNHSYPVEPFIYIIRRTL